jgi:hypothetical protein
MDDHSGVVPVSSGVAYYTVRQPKPASERQGEGTEARTGKPTGPKGIVDVHQRAMWLTESQGLSGWEALWQACAEVRRYRRYARCDRCGVVRKGVQVDQDPAGKLLAVCFYCLSPALSDD